MDTSQRKVTKILAALRTPSRTSRKATKPARMGCETLEGRQLLTGGASLPGAMPHAGKAEPVEIQAGDIEPGASSAGANDVLAPRVECTCPVGRPIAAASGSMKIMPFFHAGGPVEPGLEGPGEAATLELGPATSTLSPGSGDVATLGDFLATRGGVAMDAAAPQAVMMMAPPGAPGLGGLTPAATRGLAVDGVVTDITTRVMPAPSSAVRAGLAEVEAAGPVAPDAATPTTLPADAVAPRAAEFPADQILATVQAGANAATPGEGASQTLVAPSHADRLAIRAADGASWGDVTLLAAGPTADPAFGDSVIQTFRGAGAPATSGLALPSLAEAPNLSVEMPEAISADVAPVAPETFPTDDGLMATTGMAPVDIRTVMAVAPSRNAIKRKGGGQVVKLAAKALNRGPGVLARGGKVNRLRSLNAARRGGLKLS